MDVATHREVTMKGNMAVECYVAMHFQATKQSEVASYIAGLAELTYNQKLKYYINAYQNYYSS